MKMKKKHVYIIEAGNGVCVWPHFDCKFVPHCWFALGVATLLSPASTTKERRTTTQSSSVIATRQVANTKHHTHTHTPTLLFMYIFKKYMNRIAKWKTSERETGPKQIGYTHLCEIFKGVFRIVYFTEEAKETTKYLLGIWRPISVFSSASSQSHISRKNELALHAYSTSPRTHSL